MVHKQMPEEKTSQRLRYDIMMKLHSLSQIQRSPFSEKTGRVGAGKVGLDLVGNFYRFSQHSAVIASSF